MDCVENLLKKTGIAAEEVDIVCVSCSCFAPTPSMAAMLVNRFKFREDVLTYNLSGMGCSSSLISVDMVKHLLQALPNKLALVVNHENITNCYYTGTERSYLLVNCLFRLGGAAALMTNRPKDAARAKYDLKHTLNEKLMVPSRGVLWRFGNTSAASTWYILSHIEHHGGLRKGDRIFQLGFGGGFKAISASWRARRAIKQSHTCWPDS
ncbi:hypothetical protein WJX73_009970 [Symbiochloris irregularis]|uniref:very-long-chain 3-oxoacyl-CoA synthase n=1 Tax=Symbiochloris irregularis TaxID=706552 RepID=A0AAW1NK87_9CHLO